MRKNRREPQMYEGYKMMTVNRPDVPYISRFVDTHRSRIYVNMAAWPSATLTREF